MNRLYLPRLLALLTALPLGLIAALLLPAPVSAPADDEPTWMHQSYSEDDLRRRFGTEADEISPSQAYEYFLELVNEDRRNFGGVPPVKLDPVGMRVAQAHADDMAANGYVSHWSLDGKKPPERYNDAGGAHNVTENVSFWDSNFRLYLTKQLVQDVEERFMASKGHRVTILQPQHTHVGLGISIRRRGGDWVLAGDQEFLDEYGEYGDMPRSALPGQTVTVTGRLDLSRVQFIQAAMGREDLPTPVTPEYLNGHLGPYSMPPSTVGFLPESQRGQRAFLDVPTLYTFTYDPEFGYFEGRIPFSIDAPAGVYYVYVWVKNKSNLAFIASTNTIVVKRE
jgi:hypothetical protein